MFPQKKPVALVIIDGFGITSYCDSNAVSVAKTPFIDSLLQNYPSMLMEASGLNVGLPQGEVGNSEVGHISLGSGILRYQSLPRINKAISTGKIFEIPAILEAFERTRNSKRKLHLIGLIGNGYVHASQHHLETLLAGAKKAKVENVFIHAFLDGRDTAKDVGKHFMGELVTFCEKTGVGKIASVGGRFYGMDRNKNWDRIEKAYNAIVNGQAEKTCGDPIRAIEDSYAQEKYDEEMYPVVIVDGNNSPLAKIDDGDSVIFFNFRADRARQLTQALMVRDFSKFETRKFSDLEMITFTEYEKGLPVKVLFPPEITKTPISKIFSDYGMKQLHIAETEKYAHVTFFLNGLTEKPFDGEERILVPSPNVMTYDEKPEMSAQEVTDHIISAVRQDKFSFYAVNYANPDMVGHTGNLPASIKAVETVDRCLAQIVPEFVKKDGLVFLIGDHGNAEELVNLVTGKMDKEHNNHPVPFITVGNRFYGQPNPDFLATQDLSLLSPVGILADVAPTILKTVGLDTDPEMTGTCLL
ncbi:2,3-bisphosphoglycerate-independent phosphoglycerate mutase [Candidatus Uhrbacteria bacterium]|nr:2,3-bisphosphoglycerate-independent phosphoglycerate mutase [Candidatus Uhrbacteria bacterium]